MVIFNTSLIIDYLRRKGETITLYEKIIGEIGQNEFSISVLSVQELYQGKSLDREEEEWRVQKIILPFNILAYSVEIAKKAGKIVRDSNSSIIFADAAVAATAIFYGAKLATLNTKDFEDIKGLELYKIPA
jgi:predicted nucleic acid-binding protein